ncbi:hypothetical protein TrRE_jg1005 [Triparma retinervis]|uniref:Uncharacterized protein n=1 Tax=Triparma retinervis TaxID=2557542 RepID=A0A9W7A6A7_9STRA|nr:hypothetical protein TrRE_jg1005 [Triparma retinervis]
MELYRGNLGFFLPLTCLIYSKVATSNRVLAFGVASLLYTTVLSAWNAGRLAGDVCDLSTEGGEGGECLDVGVPPRSAVPSSLVLRSGEGGGRRGRLGVRMKWSFRGLLRKIPTADDLDEFLDKQVFTPETVTRGPLKWFADMVTEDYAKAEVLYVSIIFFILVEVGMAWLRFEMHK